MKTKLFISLTLICVLVSSCSSSAQVKKGKYNVDNFTKIGSSGGIDVYFSQGNKHYVEIEADESDIDKISVTVKNGNLELQRKKGEQFKRNSSIKAYVTAKKIEAIAMSGGADFYAKNIKCDDEFSIAASGGSDINISELKTKDCNIAISGGADCDIPVLDTRILKIAASGGSDADIKVKNADDIKAAASGGADLILSGKTKNVTVSCSGGADADIKSLVYETISSSKSGGGSIRK